MKEIARDAIRWFIGIGTERHIGDMKSLPGRKIRSRAVKNQQCRKQPNMLLGWPVTDQTGVVEFFPGGDSACFDLWYSSQLVHPLGGT